VLVYATASDYVDYTRKPAPADIEGELERASERIDELLTVAVYRTDESGMPSEPDERQAIQRATCAQAAWSLATGDPYGVASTYKDVQIGSVKLGGRTDVGGPPRYAQDAVSILRRGGLLPGYIVDGPYW
jgi:uncharacterized protein YciI